MRKASKQNIRRGLREFKNYNPMYGRRIIVRKYTNIDEAPFVFGDKNRSFTIQHNFIDTVVTPKSNITTIPRTLNTNRLDSGNRRRRMANNQRRAEEERTNLDEGIRAASTSQMGRMELYEYFSPNSLSQLSENVIIDTSINLTNITPTNLAYNTNSYDNDISDR